LLPKVTVHKIHPSTSASVALPVGPRRVDALFNVFLDRTSASDIEALKSYLLDKWASGFDVGSFCSGSEAPVLVWRAFSRVIGQRLGIGIQVLHRFSAEIEKPKQDYLLKFFPDMKRLYANVLLGFV
jgi:hypothetical protein